MSSILVSTINVNYSYLINNKQCNAELTPEDIFISLKPAYQFQSSLSPIEANWVKWNDTLLYHLSIINQSNVTSDIMQLKMNLENNLEFITGTLVNIDNNYVYKDINSSLVSIKDAFVDIENIPSKSSLNLKFRIKVNSTFKNSYVKTPLSLHCEFKLKDMPDIYYSNVAVVNIAQAYLEVTEITKSKKIKFENVGTINSSGVNYNYALSQGVVPTAITAALNSTPVKIKYAVLGKNLVLKIPELPPSSKDNPNILYVSIEH